MPSEMLLAITRKPSPSIARCELTHLTREAIDVARAVQQHQQYERLLAELGCRVVSLPAQPELPDSVFVEDAAVVLDELAVMTRPGAASRRPESASVAAAIAPHRPLAAIQPPGTLDGGDVLRLGRRILVGLSGRSNRDGIEQLRALARPHAYAVEAVPVAGCLHLKSAATQVAPDTVLLNPDWVEAAVFAGLGTIEVDATEAHAANALWVGDRVIYPAAFPRTAERLRQSNIQLALVEVSEFAKAEGGVTCCSLILRAPNALAD